MSSLGRRASPSLLASLCRAAMAVTDREQFRPERAGTPIGPWRLYSASPRDRRDAGRSWRRARCAAASRAVARSRRPTRPRAVRACRSAAHALCSPAVGQRWAHWRSPNRHPPRWAQIVNPDAAATASSSSTVRCPSRLLREPQPPPGLLNRSGSPWTLTGPVECAVGVRAGGCAPECSLRRDRPSRGSLLACGVACWPSSSSSGSASPLAMLTPPQARRSEPGGWRPRRGCRHGQQCLPCQGSRAESVWRDNDSLLRRLLLKTPQLVIGRFRCVNPAKARGSGAVSLLALEQLSSEVGCNRGRIAQFPEQLTLNQRVAGVVSLRVV